MAKNKNKIDILWIKLNCSKTKTEFSSVFIDFDKSSVGTLIDEHHLDVAETLKNVNYRWKSLAQLIAIYSLPNMFKI